MTYPESGERRDPERYRTAGLTTGRRSTDRNESRITMSKFVIVVLVFLVDVVCLAGDTLFLRNTDCL
jgi:hypothetical protein